MDEFDVIASRLAACRCGKLSDKACTRFATQEDLLCDICRPGCTVITVNPWQGQPGSVRAHYEVRGWNEIARPRGG